MIYLHVLQFLLYFPIFLRSNFNSRGVNSRELFWFFGHSSLSQHAFLMKIGGNASYKPPGPPCTYQDQDLKQQTLVFTPRNVREKSKKNHDYQRPSVRPRTQFFLAGFWYTQPEAVQTRRCDAEPSPCQCLFDGKRRPGFCSKNQKKITSISGRAYSYFRGFNIEHCKQTSSTRRTAYWVAEHALTKENTGLNRVDGRNFASILIGIYRNV